MNALQRLKNKNAKVKLAAYRATGMTKSIKRDLSTAKRFRTQGNIKKAIQWENKAVSKLIRNKSTNYGNVMKEFNKTIFTGFDKNNIPIYKSKHSTNIKSRFIRKSFTSGENFDKIIENMIKKDSLLQTEFSKIGRKLKMNTDDILFSSIKESYEKILNGKPDATGKQTAEMRGWFLKLDALKAGYSEIEQGFYEVITKKMKPKGKLQHRLKRIADSIEKAAS